MLNPDFRESRGFDEPLRPMNAIIQKMLRDISEHGEPDRSVMELKTTYQDEDAQYLRGTAVGHVLLTALQSGRFISRSWRGLTPVWVAKERDWLIFPFEGFGGKHDKNLEAVRVIGKGLTDLGFTDFPNSTTENLYTVFPHLFTDITIGFHNIPESDEVEGDAHVAIINATTDNLTPASVQLIQDICGIDVARLAKDVQAFS